MHFIFTDYHYLNTERAWVAAIMEISWKFNKWSFSLFILQRTGIMEMREAMQEKVAITIKLKSLNFIFSLKVF